jgi:DNA-binding XRE family transcriptional regulator
VNRETFIAACDENLKLVRTEFGFTQEQMAYVLGLSKKTLVDIEKERRSLGWTGSVTLCGIFQESDVIGAAFGGSPADIIFALAFEGKPVPRKRSLPSRIWWQTLYENAECQIQQNTISQHYRLLTNDSRRVASSFDLDDLLPIYENLSANKKRGK